MERLFERSQSDVRSRTLVRASGNSVRASGNSVRAADTVGWVGWGRWVGWVG